MDIGNAALPCRGIAQVPHIYFTHKGGICLNLGRGHILHMRMLECRHNMREDIGNRIRAKGTFAEHIFMPGLRMEFHHPYPGAFLPPVMLLLHQEIKLVERVSIRAVFLFIISDWFAEAYHRNPALMFQLLHLDVCGLKHRRAPSVSLGYLPAPSFTCLTDEKHLTVFW